MRLGLACAAVLVALPALAQDIGTDIDYVFYPINSDSLAGVAEEFADEGPQGFAGYTTWNVAWSAACEIEVTATITLPELAPDADLDAREAAEFARMREGLEEHEHGHVEMAMGFAREVAASGCAGDTGAIHARWLAAERAYDAETNHGETQGAWLNVD